MSDTSRTIFSGMKILYEQKWLENHAVIVEKNIIKAIIPTEMIAHHLPAAHHQFPSNYSLVPGFIDLHIHGANGHDVMDADPHAIMNISKALAQEGVTGFLATTMTADNQQIEAALSNVANAVSHEQGAKILGVHLEGPFIAKTKMGAQRGDAIQPANIALLKHWQNIAKNTIKLITLAPELPSAIDFIKKILAMDIVVSIGHTNATYDETIAAINEGCTYATHLFNAMRTIHQREPGAQVALLLANTVNAELIVDGIHLHQAMIEMALRIKGKDKLILVTDAIRAKCLGDGQFELGGQKVNVQAGKATLSDGTLAGSVLRMPQAIKNLIDFSLCSLLDAILMATYNPACILGLEMQKGTISVGKDADLVILDAATQVVFTMREGQKIYP